MLQNSPYLRLLLLSSSLFCAVSGIVLAQIQISPTRVMLTLRERSQQVNIFNPTTEPVEVTTDLDFKLIRSDSVGRMTLDSTATPLERMKSCRDWLKIFPRRFILAPGASRSVRILVLPPDSIPDGEYWGRLIVGSLPISRRPDINDTSEVIHTSLAMRIELDIPVILRKGGVETGIEFAGLSATATRSETLALVDLKRLGNSAYRGTLTASLAGADGTAIRTLKEQFTTEFTLRKALVLPRLFPGSYSLVLESVSIKKGGANDAVIAAPTVRNVYDLVVTPSGIITSSR